MHQIEDLRRGSFQRMPIAILHRVCSLVRLSIKSQSTYCFVGTVEFQEKFCTTMTLKVAKIEPIKFGGKAVFSPNNFCSKQSYRESRVS